MDNLLAPKAAAKPSLKFPIFLTLIFAVIVFYGTINHEMWRDELDDWMVVRAADSLSEIFRVLPYKGMPALWYLILYGASHFTIDPIAIQMVHLAIAVATTFIFLRFAPFHWLVKTITIFGYFPLYEYGVKSRSYVLGIVLVYGICALWKNRFRHSLWIALLLFLLFQTHAMGGLFAGMLTLLLIADFIMTKAEPGQKNKWLFFTSLAVIFAGAALSLLQIYPAPADVGYAKGWDFAFNLTKIKLALRLPVSTLFLASTFDITSHNLFWPHGAGALFMSGFAFALLPWPLTFCFFIGGQLVFLAFFYAKYIGLIWHHGHFFVILIVSLWLFSIYENPSKTKKSRPRLACKRFITAFFLITLVVQLYHGVTRYMRDLHHPYSDAKAAANFIEDHNLQTIPIVGDTDYAASAVAAYLNQTIFYPLSKRFGDHIIWRENQYGLAGAKKTMASALRLMQQNKTDVLLLLTYQINAKPDFIEPLRKAGPAWVKSERFWLYRINFKKYKASGNDLTLSNPLPPQPATSPDSAL